MNLSATVDITNLLNEKSTAHEKELVGQQIDKYCRDYGFFYIRSDLIPWNTTIHDTFKQAKRFFAESTLEQKYSLSMKKHSQHRGYFDIGDENVDDTSETTVIDIKEGFDIGLEPSNYTKNHEFSSAVNQWPEWLDNSKEWKLTMKKYFDLMLRIGRALLHGFALALKKPITHFDDLFTEPLALMRILKYPALLSYPTSANDKIYLGAGEHTDYGCITILLQDPNNGGLEIRHDNQWIKVPPVENTLVVNIGDAMEVWTSGMYKATTHRVVLSPEDVSKCRFSIPFFFEPNYETMMMKMIEYEHDKDHDKILGMKFGDYLTRRLTSTFSYRQSE
jgi:isopenicillin N synthase-like dioxygenase